MDLEDRLQQGLLNKARLKDLPRVGYEVLIVRIQTVLVVPPDGMAEKPEKLPDEHLPLRQGLVLAIVVVIVLAGGSK